MTNLIEVLNRPAEENSPDPTEGPPLAIRTGQIIMAEVKRAVTRWLALIIYRMRKWENELLGYGH